MTRLSTLLASLAVAGTACGEPAEVVDPPPVEPEVVRDPERLTVALDCDVELTSEEHVLGTSPEGDLWVAGADPSVLRVFRLRGETTEVAVGVEGGLGHVTPWSDTVATAVVGDGMWRLESEGPRFLFLPEAVRGVNFFCGDPELDGAAAVVTDNGIFERAAGQWFALGPEEGMRFAEVEWLASVDGACHLRRGGLWFGSGEDLWRVDGTSVGTFHAPGATGPAVIGQEFGLAVPAGDRVLFASERGPRGEWSEVEFPLGTVNAIGAGGGALWVSVGTHLYRYDGEWREADPAPVGALDRIFPDAVGGAWLRAGPNLCHVGTPSLELRGIRPYEHFERPVANLRVVPDQEEVGRIEASIDDDAPTSAVFGDDGWMFSGLALGAPGWHELSISVDGEVLRTLEYRVVAGDLSWVADIEPIYEEHCGGGDCHAADSEAAADLSTFDAWIDLAFEIQTRVANGTMPKDAGPEWSANDATLIIDWIQGGLQP